jgi:hypothetical protein
VKIRMIDYPDQKPFETVLLLDTIKANHRRWRMKNPTDCTKKKDYESETKFNFKKKVKANEYFNGLQVKFFMP